MFTNVLKNCKVFRSGLNEAAGVGFINGTTVNADGALNVIHRILLGTLIATQVTIIKAQSGDLADNSDMADIPGGSYTCLDADSDKIVQIEIYKPLKKYHRFTITRGTANAEIDGATTELHHNRTGPDTHDTTVASTKIVVG